MSHVSVEILYVNSYSLAFTSDITISSLLTVFKCQNCALTPISFVISKNNLLNKKYKLSVYLMQKFTGRKLQTQSFGRGCEGRE